MSDDQGHDIVVAGRLSLDAFSDQCDVHPEFVVRLVDLGLIEPEPGTEDEMWFSRELVSVVARVLRLRDGLSLNYAAVGVVMELLDRIDALEAQVARLGGSDRGR
jgi:chaperone modulatory protein CbpM